MSKDVDDDIKLQGPMRRNAPLFVGVIIVLIVGPTLSRMLETYRGIALEVRDDQMMIGLEGKPPKWIDVDVDIGVDTGVAELGSIIQKERFAWLPAVVPSEPTDHQLLRMHKRYSRAYTGVVIRISPPRTPTGASIALVQLDDGTKLNVPLWGDHLAAAQVGIRVKKEPGTWEPVLDGDTVVDIAPPPNTPPKSPPNTPPETPPKTPPKSPKDAPQPDRKNR